MKQTYQSWGNYPQAKQTVHAPYWTSSPLPIKGPILAYGQGKSYGDVCLNDGGTVISTEHLKRFISFDEESGILRCESGVTLAEILQFIVPKGWFLYVTPGTKYISLGGAIANDVHGKNHHRAGTFCHYVTQFELVRSDGSRRTCSPKENTDYFTATIGGLGLTGFITWVEIKLQRISSTFLNSETIKTSDLTETISLLQESQTDYEYVIASLDSTSRGNTLGRGHVIRGNHAKEDPKTLVNDAYRKPLFSAPIFAPDFLMNTPLIQLFSKTYYHRQQSKNKTSKVHYEPYLYPQDAIINWNLFYGPSGFIQHQCHLPPDTIVDVISELLSTVHRYGFASPITTLKIFGEKPSLGHLSFPRYGFTLALDFPRRNKKVFELCDELDTIVRSAHGSLYPAKDARMSAEDFKTFYPAWEKFSAYIDPNFSSSFWRRVTK